MELKDIPVALHLRADQVNLILTKLSLCPYGEVAELIGTLKQQGDAAIMAAQNRSPLNGSFSADDQSSFPVS